MPPRPGFSLVMPFLNEMRHLAATLASVERQSVDLATLYVVGIDNGSSDGSAAFVEAWLVRCGIAGRVLREPVRSIPRALNAGVRAARPADIIVRIDAHTTYAPTYLAAIGDAFATLPRDVACVGGAPTPPQATGFVPGLLAALYANPLGLGPADFRRTAELPRAVDHVYLGAWRPGVLQSLGGFDERWRANEDSELSARVIAAGGRVFRIAADCRRSETRGLLGTVRQWTRYGFWRAQTLKRHPTMVRLRHLAPPLALVSLAGALASPWRKLVVAPYLAYALATIAKRRPGESAAVTLATLVFFPAVHVGYACGILAGLARQPATARGGDGFEGANCDVEDSLRAMGDL